MALKVQSVNRANSPMRLVEVNYDESREKSEQKKREMEESQKIRSRILALHTTKPKIGPTFRWLL